MCVLVELTISLLKKSLSIPVFRLDLDIKKPTCPHHGPESSQISLVVTAKTLSVTWVPLWAVHGERCRPGGRRPPSEWVKVQAPALLQGGLVRVCAPPLLTPKSSPDGPAATVPVLGCSFLEESYPSLANQPSSGAKQGDVRFSSVSLIAYAPLGSTPSTWLRDPSPDGGAQALISCFLNPMILFQRGPRSPLLGGLEIRDTSHHGVSALAWTERSGNNCEHLDHKKRFIFGQKGKIGHYRMLRCLPRGLSA